MITARSVKRTITSAATANPRGALVRMHVVISEAARHAQTTLSAHNAKRHLVVAMAVVAALGSAGGAWFHGAGTALAPEPAKLNAQPATGMAAADATYVYSGTATTAHVMPNSGLVATGARKQWFGMPCFTTDMSTAAGSTTTKVVIASNGRLYCM